MIKPTSEQLRLFEALHKSRSDDFRVFNKKSYSGVWTSITDKYPESAHFVYELLQNADDAEATEVSIVLRQHELLFKHNGTKHFDITEEDAKEVGDINSITGIGDSSKTKQINKIGKFGVGFKAVFQYTDTPEIYDDIFKFKIENYIVPTLLSYDHPERNGGETLFVFPFKEPQKFFEEIAHKLETLKSPILFLRHLLKINIRIAFDAMSKEQTCTYNKSILEKVTFEEMGVLMERVSISEPTGTRHMFLFSKIITISDNENKESLHPIYAGCYYSTFDNKLITTEKQKIHCFFPTKETFGTCFVSHAPFLLTDNRQNLKPSENVNNILIDELAELVAESVVCLRDYGERNNCLLIDENISEIIPQNDYSRSTMRYVFYPTTEDMCNIAICKAFKGILSREKILLSRQGKYLLMKDAYAGKPQSLETLLSKEQLGLLVGNVHADFMKHELAVKIGKRSDGIFSETQSVDSETFVQSLTPDFMEKQDRSWVLRLYLFFSEDAKALWNLSTNKKVESLPVRYAPIVKTQEGKWVAPFVNGTTANVFFPLKNTTDTQYNFVAQEYAENESSKKFLTDLGIKTPDELDYIQTVIFPKYENGESFSKEKILSDTEIIATYVLNLEQDDRKAEVIDVIKKKFLLVCTDGFLRHLSDIYFQDENLMEYYPQEDDVKEGYFLEEEYYSPICQILGEDKMHTFFNCMGVHRIPNIEENNNISRYDLRTRLGSSIDVWKIQEYRLHDFYLKGFEKCCKHHMSKKISLYLWNEVLPILNIGRYKVLYLEYRKSYARRNHPWEHVRISSTLFYQLKEFKWIYDADGNCLSASEIYLDNLDKGYHHDNHIDEFLEIKSLPKVKSVLELGGTQEQQDYYDFGREAENASGGVLTKEEQLQAIKDAADKKTREEFRDSSSYDKTCSEEDTDIKSKLQKEWTERANRKPRHPHSSPKASEEAFQAEGSHQPSQNDDAFFTDDTTLHNPPGESRDSKVEQSMKSKNTEAQKAAQKADEDIQILDLFKKEPKYTFLWFKYLINLMHTDNVASHQKVQIDFSDKNWVCDDKMLQLTNPTVPVPTWCLEADKVSFSAIGDTGNKKIDATIVKAEDDTISLFIHDMEKVRSSIDASKLVRVVIERSSNILDSMEDRFIQLGLADDFNMNTNLTKDIQFIYGPPGTGKTTKLVSMVSDLVKGNKGMNILVLTPTNKAADVVARKMVNDDICYQYLMRFGATEDLSLIEEAAIVENRETADLSILEKNIVVTTAARYAFDYMKPDDTFICDYPWDYIIIDEASMLDIVTATLVLYKGGNTKYIISGDPKQIQPVVQNNMPTYNIYDMVGLRGFADAIRNYERYPVIALTTQHRSVPAIGNIVSQFAYNGLVKADVNRAAQKPLSLGELSISDINFLGFDIAEFDMIKGLTSVKDSAFHLYSAIFTYKMVEYTVRQIEEKDNGIEYSIGIVCPYQAEADAIKQMIECRPIQTSRCSVTVGTVHSFQGDECDIMFVVLNPPANCYSGSHINNENILNVAMSRARDYLFFVIPKGQTKGFTRKNDLGKIVKGEHYSILNCSDIEELIFGSENYICENTHVSCHMPINAYHEDNAIYEVRMSDDALDIKINEN